MRMDGKIGIVTAAASGMGRAGDPDLPVHAHRSLPPDVGL